MKVIVRPEKEHHSTTGTAWRAYDEDGTPFYLGDETLEALQARVKEFHPTAEFTLELTANQVQVLKAHAGQGKRSEDLPDGTWYTVVRNELVTLKLLEYRLVGGGHRRLFPSEAARAFLDRGSLTAS